MTEMVRNEHHLTLEGSRTEHG